MISKPVSLTILSNDEIRRLPESWLPADLRRVLEVLEVDDRDEYADEDLESVAVMALQDAGLDAAAHALLSNFTAGRFSTGQIRHLCHEIREDRAWEEVPDLSLQRSLYVCIDLLSGAFAFDVTEPSATRIELELEAPDLDRVLARHPLDAATLLRALAQCQDRGSLLNRFFSDQLPRGDFPEAASILWHVGETSSRPDGRGVSLAGSSYWLEDLEEGTFASTLRWPEG